MDELKGYEPDPEKLATPGDEQPEPVEEAVESNETSAAAEVEVGDSPVADEGQPDESESEDAPNEE